MAKGVTNVEPMTLKVKILMLVAALSLLAACGDDSASGGTLGESASAADTDVTIEVSADDPFEFDPDQIDVEAGQTVLFKVTNTGEIDHEFQIGSSGDDGGHAGHSMEGHLHLEPGESGELAWSFPEAGEVEFACHIAGHYESGMKGTITVE